jgi:hemoglobin
MTAKRDIRNREDVSLLVNVFYGKIRKDKILGPIFNSMITDWDTHLSRLTDFWESQLFLKRTYLGNPLEVHQQVDSATEGGIGPRHFGLWLNFWYETLDELFEGEVVAIAKNRARKMSTMISLKIFEQRKNGDKANPL